MELISETALMKMFAIVDAYHAKDKEKENVKHLHWIDNHNDTVSCSGCQTWFHKDDRFLYMRYCPYCGALMDEEENDNNG